MSKLCIIRGWKAVLNVHERLLPVPAESVAPVLDSLGSENDRIWPTGKWPSMILDRGLEPGSRGGHSRISYRVAEHLPGRRVEFEFEPMPHIGKFAGRHFFEVLSRDGRAILRHTIDADIDFSSWLYWKIFIERVHDALIEDAFDKAERSAGVPNPRTSRWSLYVHFLRWLRSRNASRSK